MNEISKDSGVEEWDKAIKDSTIDLDGDALSKNLALPQKPVEFDDMTKSMLVFCLTSF